MPIFDIFSKRQKKLRGEVPDVYVYDNLPNPLRVQIVHIWWGTLGNQEQYKEYGDHGDKVRHIYSRLVETLCHEYGAFQLSKSETYSEDRDFL